MIPSLYVDDPTTGNGRVSIKDRNTWTQEFGHLKVGHLGFKIYIIGFFLLVL